MSITVTGVSEIEKALEGLDGKDRANTLRRAVRAATKPFIAALKEVAAGSHVPKTFQKVPAAKVTTHGGRGPIEAYVRPASPLFNIFEPGAGPHEIAPRQGTVLANRKTGFVARGRVSHPGMAARPIVPRAFAAAEPLAAKALADAILGQPS